MLYIMHDNTHYPAVLEMDPEYFVKTGHFEFIDRR